MKTFHHINDVTVLFGIRLARPVVSSLPAWRATRSSWQPRSWSLPGQLSVPGGWSAAAGAGRAHPEEGEGEGEGFKGRYSAERVGC